jgi:hypothetical protein
MSKTIKLTIACCILLFAAATVIWGAENKENRIEDSFTKMKQLPDKIITGKVIETFSNAGRTYALIKTDHLKVWLDMIQVKLVKGKTYSFYPPYGEYTKDVSKNSTKRTFKTVWLTFGVVDATKLDLAPYSFKGIAIGSLMVEAIPKLRELGLDIVLKETETPQKVKVVNFKLGDELVDIDFIGDYDAKLASYLIKKEIGEVNKSLILLHLNYLSNVFEIKYGQPDKCEDISNLYEMSELQHHCSWRFGDLILQTYYSFKDSIGTVYATVSSSTRTMKLMNTYNAEIAKLRKEVEKDFVENVLIKPAQQGAASY